MYGKVCKICLIDLNSGYVVGEYELARCAVEKVDQGQQLCNC